MKDVYRCTPSETTEKEDELITLFEGVFFYDLHGKRKETKGWTGVGGTYIVIDVLGNSSLYSHWEAKGRYGVYKFNTEAKGAKSEMVGQETLSFEEALEKCKVMAGLSDKVRNF